MQTLVSAEMTFITKSKNFKIKQFHSYKYLKLASSTK